MGSTIRSVSTATTPIAPANVPASPVRAAKVDSAQPVATSHTVTPTSSPIAQSRQMVPTMPVKQDILTEYSYNKSLNQVIITFKRQDTGEVVEQIPPEWKVKWRESAAENTPTGFDGQG